MSEPITLYRGSETITLYAPSEAQRLVTAEGWQLTPVVTEVTPIAEPEQKTDSIGDIVQVVVPPGKGRLKKVQS